MVENCIPHCHENVINVVDFHSSMQVFHTVTRRLATAKTESTIRPITEPIQPYPQSTDLWKIHFWHSEDHASWYIPIIKPTRCTNFSNLFLEYRFSVHHQESSTVYTAIGICHTGYADVHNVSFIYRLHILSILCFSCLYFTFAMPCTSLEVEKCGY
jgi:hypothetical protein